MTAFEDPTVSGPPTGDALVTPRGRVEPGGEVLPILDLVTPWIDARSIGAIRLAGPSGSGKSVALAHLSAAVGAREGISFLDEPEPSAVAASAERSLVIFASASPVPFDLLATIGMAAWGDDDAIEYVLAAHREKRASVLRRMLSDGEREGLLGGLPEFWRIALDEMAADDAVPDVVTALVRRIDRLAPSGAPRVEAAFEAWERIEAESGARPHAVPRTVPVGLARMARHRPVCLLLAAEHVVARLIDRSAGVLLAAGLPPDLLLPIAQRARAEPRASAALAHFVVSSDRRVQPAAASLLFALDPTWRPTGPPLPRLTGAVLPRAPWSGIDLGAVTLSGANLRGADLSRANLSFAMLLRADLHRARLAGANLTGVKADRADLRRADLRGARMEGASLRHALLQGADLGGAALAGACLVSSDLRSAKLAGARLHGAALRRARLEAADLSGADLSVADASDTVLRKARLVGVDFAGATLRRCDLEGVEVAGARFRGADLTGADLSDSVMPGADFRGAVFDGAGLAGATWEGADLRDADFSNASFQMGSSRSGLVQSPFASEGTRTGFYTDESTEQDFKTPEEIRKADLRGADLRGAKVEQADWYLVDLRGTRHTPPQRAHFLRCRAILHDRAGPR